MAYSDTVQNLTHTYVVPKITDQFFKESLLPFRFMSNGKRWRGKQMEHPINLGKNTLGGSFSRLDNHSTNTFDTVKKLTYDLKLYEIPVTIVGEDEAINEDTESQIIDYVTTQVSITMESALDDVADMLWSDGTGNAGKDFLGLGAIVDNGVSVATIGNLSRSTYVQLKANQTASGGSLTLPKLSTLHSDCSPSSSERFTPSLIVSDMTTQNLYEQLLTPAVQDMLKMSELPRVTRRSKGVMRDAAFTGAHGFSAYIFKGTPWVADRKATAQAVVMLNENDIEWNGKKYSKLKPITFTDIIDGPVDDLPSENSGFQWKDFKDPINQLAEVGHLYIMGQFTAKQFRTHGKLTGVSTV